MQLIGKLFCGAARPPLIELSELRAWRASLKWRMNRMGGWCCVVRVDSFKWGENRMGKEKSECVRAQ